MFRIYTKEKKSREIFNVNLDSNELQTVMGGDIFLDHPGLNKDDYIVVEQENAFSNPTYDKAQNVIREFSREERILEGEVELLLDGEYVEGGKVIIVPAPENLLKKVWNKVARTWKEGATEEEQKTEWFNRINSWKPQVLEGPFPYIHTDGKTYYQKNRTGKDDILLSTAIQTLTRNQKIPNVEWSFDDDNNSVLLTLNDLIKLQDTGFIWTQAVYEAERELKAMKADFTKNINFFKETAIKHLDKYKTIVVSNK